VHTELTPQGYISTFVNPKVELNKIYGEDDARAARVSHDS
jgi:hypothetical protein